MLVTNQLLMSLIVSKKLDPFNMQRNNFPKPISYFNMAKILII